MQQLLLFLLAAMLLRYSMGTSNDSAVSDLSLFTGERRKCYPGGDGKGIKEYAMDRESSKNSCNSICKFHREDSRASVTAWLIGIGRRPVWGCKITFIAYGQQGITFRLHKFAFLGEKSHISDCSVVLNIYSSTTLTNLYQTSVVSYILLCKLSLGGSVLVCVLAPNDFLIRQYELCRFFFCQDLRIFQSGKS